MTRIRFLRPSPAMVISLVALFVALGGTSYAAIANLLPRNSVRSAQVVNGSLQKKDLSKKAVIALKGNRGPRGRPGATGPQGATGPTGAAGSALAYASVREDGTISASKNWTWPAYHHDPGIYCFLFGGPVNNIQVTADSSGPATSAVAGWSDPMLCGDNDQFVIETLDANGVPVDNAFMIEVN